LLITEPAQEESSSEKSESTAITGETVVASNPDATTVSSQGTSEGES